MTTPSTARKAGPFTGNGSQNSWPFTFKVFAAGDIKVTIADTTGAESVLVLGTDYTVALNSNQDTSPGGTVTYLLANNRKLTVTGDLDYDQPLDIPAGGNFNPLAFENQLDRMVMQTQQLAEELGRAVKVPVTDDGTGELSGDLAQGILALAPIVDEISAVADNDANINTVAANIGGVNLVAENIADVSNFADVYLGAKATAPTTRNDSSPLRPGDMYFDTPLSMMRVYSSAAWVDVGTATPVTITPQAFSGNGSTTVFTLSAAPAFPAALDVYISGVRQVLTANYTVSGTTLTFLSAPPAGTNNVNVNILSAYAGGVPNNGSVTTEKIADDAVTAAKIAAGAVGTSELADDAVTAAKIAAGAVGTSELTDDAVTAAKIAAGAVGTSEIADANVTPAKFSVDARFSMQGFRNRIINGDMRIDQRNNGAAVTNAVGYIVDRWADFKAGSGQYTAQRSTLAPVGFTNSFQHTVTTAVSPAAGDVYQVFQPIEGFNTADLGFGTASAQSVTVSFWVRSSVTGLYAVSLRNNTPNRSHVSTYTVLAANTWEYKTVTVPGDTTGTWLTDNGAGIFLVFDLGSGSNQNTTAGAWQAGDFRRTSGCVNWISTNGATFYITGVQLEAGSVASPFERRDIGRELIMCQRYYERGFTNSLGTVAQVTTEGQIPIRFKVTKRASPTFSVVPGASLTASVIEIGVSFRSPTAFSGTADADGVTAVTSGVAYSATLRPLQLASDVLQVSAEL